MKKVLGTSVLVGATAVSYAQLLSYDDFSSVNGGSGWAGAYTGSTLNYTNSSPLRPELGQYVTIGEFGEAFRQVSAATKAAIDARTAGSNSFWVGFVTRWSGATGAGQQNYGGIQLREGTSGTGVKRFFMGVPWEVSNWGASREADGQTFESSTPIGAGSVFLSFEINLGTHLASMYIDNSLAVSGMQLDTGSTLFTTLDFIKIEAGSGTSQLIAVDEVRIGINSGDVQPVPEPATLAALGIGALALMRRRRQTGN